MAVLFLVDDVTVCGVCGAWFTHTDVIERVLWSQAHAAQHPRSEHRELRESGLTFTPVARKRLEHIAVPVIDLVLKEV